MITDQPSLKLDYENLGSFEIIGNKGIFMELQLLQSIKIHNAFYSNLPCKALIDLLTNQINEPQSLVVINNKKKVK